MQTVLTKADRNAIQYDPFPHLVISNALDEALYEELAATMPAYEVLRQGNEGSTTRIYYEARHSLAGSHLNQTWKAFIEAHLSQTFLDQFLSLFGPEVADLHPELLERIGPFETWQAQPRHFHEELKRDVSLDASIVINPSRRDQPMTVRGPHVDKPNKLFTGLLYMRHPEDTSRGGDLELYQFKSGKVAGLQGREVDSGFLHYSGCVRYAANTLVIFPGHIHAPHGVSPRTPTDIPRLLCAFVGDLGESYYNMNDYQLDKVS